MKDTFYFPHDTNARQDEKLLYILSKYGVAGYGLFWMFIEAMHEQADGKLTCTLLEGLRLSFNTDITLLQQFYNEAITIELFITDGVKYWNERVLRNKGKFEEKRRIKSEAGKRGMQSRYGLNNSVITEPNTVITEPNKVNKSKVNKTKKNNTSKKFDAPQNSELLEESKRFSEWFKTLLPEAQKTSDTDLKNWAECYVQLQEIDKRSKKEISMICKFARSDDFWNKNFLSPLKLRRKDKSGVLYYDVLKAAMDNGRQNTRSPAALPDNQDFDPVEEGKRQFEKVLAERKARRAEEARLEAIEKERMVKTAEVQ